MRLIWVGGRHALADTYAEIHPLVAGCAAPARCVPYMGVPQGVCDFVLVVDDDQMILDSLCALLRATGFEVAGACSADVAMALLDDGLDPDVILTDLSMPGHDGADLADTVRAQPRRQRTAIVAMSACSRSLEGFRSKADAKLQKPFDLPALLQAFAHARAARPLGK